MVTLCPISDGQIGIFDPATLINADYEEPLTVPRPWFRIKTYVGTTPIELNRHYVSKSYKDNWLWGTISTASFQLDDFHATQDNLPCSFVDGQKIVIRDWNNIRVVWYGFVRGTPDADPYGKPRLNGSYRTITTIEMQDAWSLMESKPYKANYPAGTKAGAVLKGAFTQAGFNASNIDALAGPEVGPFDVNDQYPSEIAEQMMSLLDWTYWFDIQVASDLDLPIPYAGPKESSLVRVPYAITETNWHWVFDPKTFKLRPAQEDYANQVEYTFPRIYSTGRATFQNGSNVMLGYDGDVDNKWSLINLSDARSSLNVEIPSTGANYTLQKNNSDSSGTNEFILGGEYQEADSALIVGVDVPTPTTLTFEIGTGSEDFYPGYDVTIFSAAYPAGETRTVASVVPSGGGHIVTLTSVLPSAPNVGDLVGIAGIPYVIKGSNFTIIRNNATEIARTKAVSGGTGIRSKKVTVTNIEQTYEQASVTAAFEVALYSRQYWRGQGTITTSWAGHPQDGYADWLHFWVGKTLSVNLPNSKKISNVMLRIEGMSRQDIGGGQRFADGASCQAFSNQLTFTPSLYQNKEQIRALFKTTRKIASSSSSRSSNLFKESVVAVKDCLHLVTPLGAGIAASINILEVYDTVTLIPIPDPVTIFITSGTSWTVPSDWNDADNTVETIGAGAGGNTWSSGAGVGGGAGAYSSASNIALTPGDSITVQVGVGGAANTSGTDTWFNGASLAASSVGSKGGAAGSGSTGGVGGASASGIGTTKYSGGNGGNNTGSNNAGTGGGGAAGPHGVGANGGAMSGSSIGLGTGGGGADNGTVGLAGSFGVGGAGGANRNGTGRGTTGGFLPGPPADGGGGGGGDSTSAQAQAGSSGEVLWTQTSDSATAGPGGGGGGGGFGGTGRLGGNGGAYGAGGGGGGNPSGVPGWGVGGTGSNGIIAVTYRPVP